MALNSADVRAFGFGHVYAAPVGTTAPTSISAPVGVGWIDLGHVSDAGPRFSFGKARTPVRSWQSYPDPVRNLRGESITSISVDTLEWNGANLPLALGGGTWAEGTAGEYEFTPANSAETDDRALIVELEDDDIKYRFLFKRVENQANTDFAATATAVAPLPLQFVVLAPASGSPYTIQTDDPTIEDVIEP